MEDLQLLLVTVGGILLAALPLSYLARRVGLPRVTLLIALGLLVGALGLLPETHHVWYPAIAQVSLSMVGLLLGGEFTLGNLRERGRAVLAVSVVVTLATFAAVTGGMVVQGLALPLALVLGAASTATDPAACEAVAHDTGSDGPLTRTLLGVVAIDDVWGLLLFAAVSTVVAGLVGESGGAEALLDAGLELGGSLLLGGALGLAMALVTGRVRPGEPTRTEALGFVLLSTGLAAWLDLSYLITAVTMGAVVANVAKHHDRAFREIEGLEWPFLAAFFVLSGASATLEGVATYGALAAAYVGLRILGRVVGGYVGAWLGGTPARQRLLLGPALLPQAGVALGMTLVAVDRFPELGGDPLAVVVLGTVVFELIGPLLTRWVLTRAGDAS